MAVAADHAQRRELEAAGRPARHATYVWELPVRIVHWTIVLALVVLSVTGYYIHNPFVSGSGGPGHPGFTMGTIRFVHEVTGFVFIAAVLFRVYWAFAGNRYAHWRALLPVTGAQRHDLRETARYYGLRRRHPPRMNGHNPLAGLAYVVLYVLFLLSILSGLGLFAWVSRIPAWRTLFGWTWSVLPIQQLRLLHFLLMFAFGAFLIHHVYSAMLIDVEERNGEFSSMITGYKADLLEGDTPRDDPRRYPAMPREDRPPEGEPRGDDPRRAPA
jgi:Ni/Fe-hydrogenase 1 B-type cytochrome subunit